MTLGLNPNVTRLWSRRVLGGGGGGGGGGDLQNREAGLARLRPHPQARAMLCQWTARLHLVSAPSLGAWVVPTPSPLFPPTSPFTLSPYPRLLGHPLWVPISPSSFLPPGTAIRVRLSLYPRLPQSLQVPGTTRMVCMVKYTALCLLACGYSALGCIWVLGGGVTGGQGKET